MKIYLAGIFAGMAWSALAQGVPPNVLVQALRDGHATLVVSREDPYGAVVRAIQAKTGDLGPVEMVASRILRFKQQPNCGRVVFVIGQPSSHIAWADMGGQLNICESGSPPLRVCDAQPDTLVPPEALCGGGKAPHDTAEVAAAIQQALKGGSLSHDQVRQQLVDAQKVEETKRASP